jgi:hypothetical protein
MARQMLAHTAAIAAAARPCAELQATPCALNAQLHLELVYSPTKKSPEHFVGASLKATI